MKNMNKLSWKVFAINLMKNVLSEMYEYAMFGHLAELVTDLGQDLVSMIN